MKNKYTFVLGLTFLVAGCSSEDVAPVSGSAVPNGNVRILAGASVGSVLSATSAKVTVNQVNIVRTGSGEEVALSGDDDSVDLEHYCDGSAKNIAENSIPEGDYDEVHLVISSASLDLDDQCHFDFDVTRDNDRDVRVRLPHPIHIDRDHDNDIRLDIDLDKTFVDEGGCSCGNHYITFKPVVTPVTPAPVPSPTASPTPAPPNA